jgi:hypothetical protein
MIRIGKTIPLKSASLLNASHLESRLTSYAIAIQNIEIDNCDKWDAIQSSQGENIFIVVPDDYNTTNGQHKPMYICNWTNRSCSCGYPANMLLACRHLIQVGRAFKRKLNVSKSLHIMQYNS